MKNELREVGKQLRDKMDQIEREAYSRKICLKLMRFLKKEESRHVYCYYPLGSEADILPLAEKLLEQGVELAFPRVNGNDMSFIQIRNLVEDFKEGAFHIMEPVSDQMVDWPDAYVLVPGLVFDKEGNRIGYGKGYYDRYFSRHSHESLIGITYQDLVITNIPAEKHDLKMDVICTEKEISAMWP